MTGTESLFFFLHRHRWKIVKQSIQKTPFETMTDSRGAYKEITGYEWFERDVIVMARCEKCGSEKVYRA